MRSPISPWVDGLRLLAAWDRVRVRARRAVGTLARVPPQLAGAGRFRGRTARMARLTDRRREFSVARPTVDAAPMCVGTHFASISWQLLSARVRVANRAI